VLLRLQSLGFGGAFAEVQEAPDLVPKVAERSIIGRCQVGGFGAQVSNFRHIYIVSRYFFPAVANHIGPVFRMCV
jgi:hypothetical protein